MLLEDSCRYCRSFSWYTVSVALQNLDIKQTHDQSVTWCMAVRPSVVFDSICTFPEERVSLQPYTLVGDVHVARQHLSSLLYHNTIIRDHCEEGS